MSDTSLMLCPTLIELTPRDTWNIYGICIKQLALAPDHNRVKNSLGMRHKSSSQDDAIVQLHHRLKQDRYIRQCLFQKLRPPHPTGDIVRNGAVTVFSVRGRSCFSCVLCPYPLIHTGSPFHASNLEAVSCRIRNQSHRL